MFISDPVITWGDNTCTLRGVEHYDRTPLVVTWRYSAIESVALYDGNPLYVRIGAGHAEVRYRVDGQSEWVVDMSKLRDLAGELARRMEACR